MSNSPAPKDRVIEIKVGGEKKPWLPAHEAITWFREEYPGAQSRISTRIEQIEGMGGNIVLAEVFIRNDEGKMELVSTARKMSDGKSSLEKMETAAIRRALAYLGYGTVAAMSDDGDGLSPEERARVEQVLHDQTPAQKEAVKKALGTGSEPRRLGGQPPTNGSSALDEYTFDADFDFAYFDSIVSGVFKHDQHKKNAIQKMFREGDLRTDMGADAAIAAVFSKYQKENTQ